MALYFNTVGPTTVNGTAQLDRFYAFTRDTDFSRVRPDAVIPTFTWTTSLADANGQAYQITGVNVQISQDIFFSNGGTDVLYGSNLNDAIFYNNGTFQDGVGGINGIQQFYMGLGDDIADFSAHGPGGVSYAKQLLVHGEDGNDVIVGGANNDELYGDAGNDTVVGNAGGDNIFGGIGNDILYGDDLGANLVGGQDVIRGDDGDDTIYGGAKTDQLLGGEGNDVLNGNTGDDVLFGGNGADILYGDDVGGIGGDKLNGENGNDKLFGRGGDDIMSGGNDNDTVDGGDGNDNIKGDTGDDVLVGGTGNDNLNGGDGVDTAVYSGNRADYLISLNADGTYQITDTRPGAVNEGSDRVGSVEFFQFADGTIPLSQLDNPPVITSNGGGSSASVSIDENTSAVTTVTATDIDVGQTLTYGIAGGADASLFKIDPVTGELSFKAGPDFENPIDSDFDGIYNVVVSVSDGIIATTQQIAVSINDVADGAAPVITSNGGGRFGTVDVDENQTAATTLTATDPDGTTPTYRIAGGADAALFTVDPATGQLKFITAPDFESPQDADRNNSYEVIVEATDGVNSDRQILSVNVQNTNDNTPVITSSPAASIDENTKLALTVTATDADATTPGFAPTYSIVGGNDAALFTIDATTGAVSFINAPDYENPLDFDRNNVYNLIVQASDGKFSSQQAVSVSINNLNDTAPVITSNGGGATATITLPENGTAVTTVAATDADGPKPTYSIVGGQDAALFTIDAVTGALVFKSAPDFENPEDFGKDNHYDVIVQASDGTFVDQQVLDIAITDVNEIGKVINGTIGNDTISPTAVAALRTTALNDTVFAGDGNDIIDGGLGVDRMEGGNGNDTYYVGTYSDDGRNFNDDLVIEQANGGADRVIASVSYVLADNVENLTLAGTADLNGTGNILDNQLLGNSGANLIAGGAGLDTILGNDGNDTLSGDDGADQLVGGNGTDSLLGGAGNDRLDGGVGADTMAGGADNDTYIVDTYTDDGNAANDDLVVEVAGGGIDAVSASVSYILTAEVENLTLTGSAAINGTGNELANTITGNNAANTVNGLDGNDTISGLGGNDALYGGAGSDTVDGGTGNDSLYGGDASDLLTGSAGLDTLNGGLGKDTLTGGTEADTFVFNFGDTTLNTNADRITDFQGSAGDKIDLDSVTAPLAAGAYAEGQIATDTYADALALAKTLMNTSTPYVFVGGQTTGWLFWDGAGKDGLPDQSIVLTGVNSTSLFDGTMIV
jgi:Ca2+-binding RTX toxin-like protein